jgi:signal transduction histidine kinase
MQLRSGIRADRGLFSQLEVACAKQPGSVALGVLEWSDSGQVVAAGEALLNAVGHTQEDIDAAALSLEQMFSRGTVAKLAALGPAQVIEGELLLNGREPVRVMLCVSPASEPRAHNLALVMTDPTLNIQLQLDALILGIVSHELRTPLGVIGMAANLLMSDAITPTQRRTVQRIMTASRHCDRLVADLLDFTMARGAGITLMRGQRDLHTIAAQALEDVRATWPGRDVEHERVGTAESFLDEDRVAQIILNLVNNALQHSPPATKVFVQTRGELGEVVLSVTNAGPPIPDTLIAELFSPLRRGESAGARRGSLGLGLFIVHHLVVAHAGSIDVTSNGTDGTRFTIRLPVLPPTAA